MFMIFLLSFQPFGHNLSQASILEQNTILKATNLDFPAKPPVSQEAKVVVLFCVDFTNFNLAVKRPRGCQFFFAHDVFNLIVFDNDTQILYIDCRKMPI